MLITKTNKQTKRSNLEDITQNMLTTAKWLRQGSDTPFTSFTTRLQNYNATLYSRKLLSSDSVVKIFIWNVLLKKVREIGFRLECRGHACHWRLCENLFVWISNWKTWNMWSLTECDISGLMLLIWCVKWCRMCHLQCAEQILLANQDRCREIRWCILLRTDDRNRVFSHLYIIHMNILTKHNKQGVERILLTEIWEELYSNGNYFMTRVVKKNTCTVH